MARGPLAAPSGQEEIHEEDIDQEGSGGVEGQEGSGEAEDAALDTGEEQEAGGDEDVELEPPPSRGETRFQRLANENAELRRRLTDLERRPAPVQQFTPQEETEEQFNARIQLLLPDERMEQRQLRSERRFNQQVHALRFQTQVQQDKVLYDAKAASDPRFKRYADDVEAKHAELLAQGQLVPRAEILKWLIGDRIVSGHGAKDADRQRAAGKRNVQRQQARPSGARSDVQGSRGRVSEAEARRRRLENMEL